MSALSAGVFNGDPGGVPDVFAYGREGFFFVLALQTEPVRHKSCLKCLPPKAYGFVLD